MRIIAGQWRGRTLAAPAGSRTRPTSDRAREGLFSMLTSRLGSFEGLRAADLFAGSGALGLEALSRGAACCLFVDNDREAVAALKRNAAALDAEARAEIKHQSAEHLAPPDRPFDLVFLDPPYEGGLAERALAHVADARWLAPGALVSVETGERLVAIPATLEVETERRFGKARLHLLRARF
ncbi:MAG TPA: 16S rRNA (guanine(966)-N(2))-methyltransferase RsmD [Allosphingosinicella sp.]|nr:16S rRNA (guanine(966)-N(2))-methyltransferase RsmD [Allosphingosinicella sp.]